MAFEFLGTHNPAYNRDHIFYYLVGKVKKYNLFKLFALIVKWNQNNSFLKRNLFCRILDQGLLMPQKELTNFPSFCMFCNSLYRSCDLSGLLWNHWNKICFGIQDIWAFRKGIGTYTNLLCIQ